MTTTKLNYADYKSLDELKAGAVLEQVTLSTEDLLEASNYYASKSNEPKGDTFIAPKVKTINTQVLSVNEYNRDYKDNHGEYKMLAVTTTNGVFHISPVVMKANIGDMCTIQVEQCIAGKTGYKASDGTMVLHTKDHERIVSCITDKLANITEQSKAAELGKLQAKIAATQTSGFNSYAEVCKSLGISVW